MELNCDIRGVPPYQFHAHSAVVVGALPRLRMGLQLDGFPSASTSQSHSLPGAFVHHHVADVVVNIGGGNRLQVINQYEN